MRLTQLRPTHLLLAACLLTARPALGEEVRDDAVPITVGQCVSTTIAEIANRLEGVPESGDAVLYGNGIYGVSYDKVPALTASQVGDAVELCLTFVDDDCPPEDQRGKYYSAMNERTGQSWELSDDQHMCGGA